MRIEVSSRWRETFPGGHVGVLLVANVNNQQGSEVLEPRKRALEARLKQNLGGLSRADLHELDVLRAYRTYYKRFDQTYHVQGQLESVIHKGKSLPTVSPLVDAAFIAELETLVLTASHDADLLEGTVDFDATQGGEAFVQMSGKERSLKANDMMMRDGQGIVCTILYGQDRRTPISPSTRRALFVAYAPPGVPADLVRTHLETICDLVVSFAPDATLEQLEVFSA